MPKMKFKIIAGSHLMRDPANPLRNIQVDAGAVIESDIDLTKMNGRAGGKFERVYDNRQPDPDEVVKSSLQGSTPKYQDLMVLSLDQLRKMADEEGIEVAKNLRKEDVANLIIKHHKGI